MFVGVDLVKIARWERILEKFPAARRRYSRKRRSRIARRKGKSVRSRMQRSGAPEKRQERHSGSVSSVRRGEMRM